MKFEIFRSLLFIPIPVIISCGNPRKDRPLQPTISETELAVSQVDKYSAIWSNFFPFLQALSPEVELTDGKAYRKFKGDTTRHRLLPDSVYSLGGDRALLLLRCIPGEGPCSHAEAAYFQLVIFNLEGDSLKVLQESSLLPVYSPWCDKLEPRILSIKGVPHLLFEMSDSHQESWRERYWMISVGERNFGALVWEEEIYTKGLKEGDRDEVGVFPVEEMEAEVEFDTSRCAEGIWIVKLSKTFTKSISNATEGEPSPESQGKVDSFKPIIKKERLQMIYRMNNNGKLVRQ